MRLTSQQIGMISINEPKLKNCDKMMRKKFDSVVSAMLDYQKRHPSCLTCLNGVHDENEECVYCVIKSELYMILPFRLRAITCRYYNPCGFIKTESKRNLNSSGKE